MALIGASNSLGGLAGSNALARLLVVISGDSTPLTNALRSAQGQLSGFSRNASAIGRTFTRFLTLPLLGLGGAVIKMSMDFQAAMARVGGLTPLLDQTGLSLSELSNQVMDLARDPLVTAGPEELADALYFAGSAGLEFRDAMDIVKLSAQGASIGMGNAADLSKILIFALNNYPEPAMNAARAMDTLTAAIQEGTAEPAELAIALGRLLPIAAEAGITFEQVTASVAALTNLGMPTRVATTSLRALFSQLLSPTIQATELLHGLGVEAEDLRDSLTAGPIAAFRMLQKATRGNIDYLHDLIPQIRGFTAYLGLTVDETRRYNEIIKSVNHSQGKFQKALQMMSKTPSFKFERAIKDLKIAAIDLGSFLVPVFNDIVAGISAVAKAFSQLSPVWKKAMAGFMVAGIAFGPVMQLVGALSQTTQYAMATNSAVTILGPSLRALGLGAITAGLSIGAVALSFLDLAENGSSLINMLGVGIGTFTAVRIALVGLRAAATSLIAMNLVGSPFFAGLALMSGGMLTVIALGLAGIALGIAKIVSNSHQMDRAAEQMQTALLEGASSGQKFRQTIKQIEDQDFAEDLRRMAEAANLIDLPTGAALEELPGVAGVELANSLRVVQNELDKTYGSAEPLPGVLQQYAEAARVAGAGNKNFAETLLDAGLDLDDLLDILGDAEGSLDRAGLNGEAAEEASRLARSLQNTTEVYKEFNDAQLASLYANQMEGESIEALAQKYGVSTEFMESKLSDAGLAAFGMSQQVETGFAKAYFSVREDGSKISAKAVEMAEAIDEAAGSISESMVGAFDLFNKLPEKFEGSTAQMIKRAEAWSGAMVDQAVNVRKLMAQGVPLDLIGKLVEDGPDAVKKFANASETQIHRAVLAYQIGLGAMDKEILKEGAHQETKGRSIVQDFATAMLSKKFLFPATGRQIIDLVVQGLQSGKMKPAALDMVTQFMATIISHKNIPEKAGNQMMLAFAQGLATGNIIDKSGNIIISALAKSIREKSGVPKQEAIQIAKDFAGSLGETAGQEIPHRAIPPFESGLRRATAPIKSSARQDGRDIANQLAGGIVEGTPAAEAAAYSMGLRTKAALEKGLQGSPHLFTYYAGIELNKELARGLSKKVTMPELQRPVLSIYDNMGPAERRRSRRLELDLDVRMDRMKAAKDLEWGQRARGY